MSRMVAIIAISLERLIADRRGVTALEYGIMTAAIIIAIVGSLNLIGSDLAIEFSNIGALL